MPGDLCRFQLELRRIRKILQQVSAAGHLVLADDQDVAGIEPVRQAKLAFQAAAGKIEATAKTFAPEHTSQLESPLECLAADMCQKQIGSLDPLGGKTLGKEHDQAVQPHGESEAARGRPPENFR